MLPKASGGEEDTGDDESGMLGLDFTIVWGSRQGIRPVVLGPAEVLLGFIA